MPSWVSTEINAYSSISSLASLLQSHGFYPSFLSPIKQICCQGDYLCHYWGTDLAIAMPVASLVTELVFAERLRSDTGPVNYHVYHFICIRLFILSKMPPIYPTEGPSMSIDMLYSGCKRLISVPMVLYKARNLFLDIRLKATRKASLGNGLSAHLRT